MTRGIKKELLKYWKTHKTATLHELGMRFLVTRERVRQILSLYDKKAYKASRYHRPSKVTILQATCQQCNKTISYNKGKKTPKYCSPKCYSEGITKYKTQEERKQAWRDANRRCYLKAMADPIRSKLRINYRKNYIKNKIKKSLAIYKKRLAKQFQIKLAEAIAEKNKVIAR